MKEAPYTPVSCDLHSRLELAVMRREVREWVWNDGSGEQRLLAQPLDVVTRDQAEWLLLSDQTAVKKDATCWLRLDWLKD